MFWSKDQISTDKKKIDDLLSRGVEEAIVQESIKAKLSSGNKLRIKLGIDPTSPNIHIGRAVVLWKLRQFQELGHQVVFIVGDFTGLIGDTSDKDSERPMLTEQEIKKNLKTYFDQAFKILDKQKTETHYNSTWLKKLDFLEIGKMADLFGLHEMAARENVAKRMSEGKRVSFRELLYPIMQGYDSVAVKADVELGGTDQRFNLLAGRTIQPAYGQKPQDILMTALLLGTDGRKMSSSWGNVINITDLPNNMFGKVMSINDELIKKYFILATQIPLEKVDEIISASSNPKDQKIALAKEIVSMYHGKAKAEKAEQNFISTFSNKEIPKDVPEVDAEGDVLLSSVMLSGKVIESKSDFSRLVKDGAITKLDPEKKITDIFAKAEAGTYRIGKHRFIKIKIK